MLNLLYRENSTSICLFFTGGLPIVTAYFHQGQNFIITSVLEILPAGNQIILDIGADPHLNHQLLNSKRTIFVSTLDQVRIQFSSPKIEHTDFQGKPALKIALPSEVLKLQRREFYRLQTPVSHPVKCEILLHEDCKTEVLVYDISLGGVALTRFEEKLTLETGTMMPDCKILLPGFDPVSTGLEVRNIHTVQLRSGEKTLRAGCMFFNFPPIRQSAIQRYINKLERERRNVAPAQQ